MTASTVTSTQAGYGDKLIEPVAKRVESYFTQIPNRPHGERLWLLPAVTIPTTSIDDVADIVKLFKIPANIGPVYLLGLKCVSTAMDVHATPTLAFTIETYTTTDGTALITATTTPQAGGTAVLSSANTAQYTDISGKFIAMKVTTAAATAAAGTITISMNVYCGRAVQPV